MLICCYWSLGSDACTSNIFLLFHLNNIDYFSEDLFLLIHSSDFQGWVYKLVTIDYCQEQKISTMFVGHPVLHRDAGNQTDRQ